MRATSILSKLLLVSETLGIFLTLGTLKTHRTLMTNSDLLLNLNFRMTDLPSLEDSAPPIIEKLIFKMLEKHPSSRLSSEEAATICQVLLWAPQAWTNGTIQPTSQQILQWTMTMATKVIYECKFSNSPAAQATLKKICTACLGWPGRRAAQRPRSGL